MSMGILFLYVGIRMEMPDKQPENTDEGTQIDINLATQFFVHIVDFKKKVTRLMKRVLLRISLYRQNLI